MCIIHDAVGIILGIGLGNVCEVNLPVTQLLFQHFNPALRNHVDCVVYLHLQDQVGSTLEIEAQVDMVCQRREQAFSRQTLGNPEDSEEEKEHGTNDEYELPEKILGHMKSVICGLLPVAISQLGN